MLIEVDYMGVHVHINKNTKKISILEDNTDTEILFDMVFKAILNNINITDINNYSVDYNI